jgi:hypothetical protein
MSSIFSGMFGDLVKDINNVFEDYDSGGVLGVITEGISREYNETIDGWTFMKLMGSTAGSAISGIQQGWNWMKETVGGWFAGEEQQQTKDLSPVIVDDDSYAAQIRKIRELEQSGKDKDLIQRLLEYQIKIEAQEEANKEKAENGEYCSVFENTEEAFDYIQTKKELGLPLDANDAKMLAQTKKQMKDGGQFSNEFANYIKENKDKFSEFNIPELDLEDNESINVFAINVTKSACFINTIFMNIVLSNVTEGVPNSWGDMYVKAMDRGLLNMCVVNSSQY